MTRPARWIRATGFRRWMLDRLGMLALVIPFTKSVWMVPNWELPDHVTMREIVTHENVHIAQIERDGRIWFTVMYLYYLARYGYRNSPYEREAYGSGK